MNLAMGSQKFTEVAIPLLWGTRAIVQDKSGRLSVIDLSGSAAKLEILGDKPAPGMEFIPTDEGFQILSNSKPLYDYNPKEKILHSISLELAECQINNNQVRIGTNTFSGNVIQGFGVGIAVTDKSIAIGAPLPPNLAKLVVN